MTNITNFSDRWGKTPQNVMFEDTHMGTSSGIFSPLITTMECNYSDRGESPYLIHPVDNEKFIEVIKAGLSHQDNYFEIQVEEK